MRNFYKRVIYKNGYLLIIAAWFYTLSFVVGNYFNYNNTPLQVKKTLEEYLHVQEEGFENLTNNLAIFTRLADEESDKSELNLYKSPSGIFIYKMSKDSTLKHVFWSRFDMEIFPEELAYKDGSYFVNHTNGNYELIKKTVRLDSNTFIAAGLIPIKSKYFIENKYLKNTFTADKNIGNDYDITAAGGIPVVNSKGQELFYIDRINASAKNKMPLSEGILKVIAIIFCLIFLNYCILDIADRRGFKKGFVLLLASLFIVRGISYFLPFPFDFSHFELFDPAIYATSSLHPSLGALLINALLLLWVTKFVRYRYNFSSYKLNNKKDLLLSYGFFIGFVLISFYLFHVIRSLVVDSGIPFNVINIFELNIYTITAFFIVSVLVLNYYNFTYILMQPARRMSLPLWQKIAIILVLGVFVLFLLENTISLYVRVGMIVWLIGYISYVHYKIDDLESRLIRSPYFLFWVIFYSFSATFLLRESEVFEKLKVKNILENFSSRSINTDDNLLRISIEELNTSFLNDNFYRFGDSVQNNFIKDSIYFNNLSAYLNNFNVNIYAFNGQGKPLFNADTLAKSGLDSFVNNSLQIAVKNLYYSESDEGGSAFVYRKIVQHAGNKDSSGTFYLKITPKEYVDNNLYLQLLAEADDIEQFNNNYYIAVYKNNHIINEIIDYDFPDTINTALFPVKELYTVHDFEGNQYWYNAGKNKMIVLVKRNGVLFEFIAMFSYLLGFSMLFILLINLLYFLIESRFRRSVVSQKVQLSLRTRIYTAIIFVSLFSFFIIGGSTISFFVLNFEKENLVRINSVIKRFVKEIEFDAVSMYGKTGQMPSQQELNEFITSAIMKLSFINNENINFYNTNGRSVATSQPYIYNRKILSSQMNPLAYNQMKVNNKRDFYQNEQIGSFKFLSGYAPLHFKGRVAGFINIPFLNSQSQLNKNISSFITIVIILTALVFLLAGVLSVFLTQRILNSFSVLKDRMKMINIGKENEELYWERDDELGGLIREYNRMVRKLDESVQQLARTEREGAWQQMARQVAHEIKNPLTPMKLNLQFLQKLIDNGDESSKALSKRISESLIDQIDQLALIAGDFGQFANIGYVRLEKFHISEVLDNLVEMYSVESDYDIVYKKSGEDLIYFDRTQTARLFTNLIKNALEASSAEENNSIEIIMQDYGDNVVVSVHDYGMGIDEEKAKKIFVPNFTTKSSGTGLGLAISRGIVENAKGRIWFESIPGVGTTFYVSLPLFK